MKITGTTRLLGVIGDPISHSLSPLMHNTAIAQMGLDYVYLPFPIHADRLSDAIAGFEAINLVGFNVTIPHKQLIIPFLAEVSPLAKAVGAVNTVWQTPHGWHGTNTDVEGFLAPLLQLQRDWSQVTAICLGNGGAARAVVAACDQLGCREIQVVGRNFDKLQHFYDSWHGSALRLALSIHNWEQLPKLLAQADLIVNASPIGMKPNVEVSPISDDVAAKIRTDAIAYDLIYVPNPTQFLRQAQAQGATAINGLEMLVQQGAAALKIWTNQSEVPVDAMRQALRQHLGL